MASHDKVRRYVEARIKAALEAGRLEDFISWLAVANGGSFDANQLNYQFLDDSYLFDYVIQKSADLTLEYQRLTAEKQNKKDYLTKRASYLQMRKASRNTKKYLLSSQSLIRNVMRAFDHKPEVKLSDWQKFLSRKISKKLESKKVERNSGPSFDQFRNKLINSILTPTGVQLKNVVNPVIAEEKKETDEKKVSKETKNIQDKPKKRPNLPTTEADVDKLFSLENIQMTSIAEEYTPIELLQRPELLRKRMGLNEPSKYQFTDKIQQQFEEEENEGEKKHDPNSLPAHLRHWSSSLSFTQGVNFQQRQAEQQVNQQQIQEQQVLSADQSLGADLELKNQESKYVDSSQRVVMKDKSYGGMLEINSEAGLGKMIKLELERRDPKKKFTVMISGNARLALKKHDASGGVVFTDAEAAYDRINPGDCFNIDYLPYGFHLDKVTTDQGETEYHVLFSDQLRTDQKASGETRLDLGGLNVTEIKNDNRNLQDLRPWPEVLRPHENILSQEQRSFIEKEFPEYKSFISHELNRSPELLIEFITQLMGSKDLLDLIKERYLAFNQFGPLTQAKNDALKNLAQLFQPEYKPELDLFILLSSVNSGEHGSTPFSDIWGAHFNLSHFLKEKGQRITEQLVNCIGATQKKHSKSGSTEAFLRLKQLQDCLSQVPMLELQMSLLHLMPQKLCDASSSIKRGYAFVHRYMFLDWDCPDDYRTLLDQSYEDIRCISPSYFDNRVSIAPSGSQGVHHFQAIYLRYLASSVDPEYIKNALDKWEEITKQSLFDDDMLPEQKAKNIPWDVGMLDKLYALNLSLKSNWPQLSKYLLGLPTRLDKPKEEKSEAFVLENEKMERESKRNAMLYHEEDLNRLLPLLKLESSLEVQLKGIISKINALTPQFIDLEDRQLRERINKIKNREVQNDEKASPDDQLVEMLCVLREVHYRQTLKRSTKKQKTGEWLRLEQLISILVGNQQSELFQNETSEGKTLIINFIAILDALQRNKVNLVTHTELMADRAFNELTPLAAEFGLKLANKNKAPDKIRDCDIYCVDLSTAVIDDTLDQFTPEDKKGTTSISRRADVLLIDEADNIAIDVHANTTMQISVPTESKQDANIEGFINALNRIIRSQLTDITDKPHLAEQKAQIEFIKDELARENIIFPEDDLDYWIKAAVAAMNLKLNQDYIIQADRVRIVHKKTTGSVDTRSEWGNGVHYCVSAWEKSKTLNSPIKLPEFSEILAEGDVASYIQKHKKRCAFTGTFGSPDVLAKMQDVIGPDIIHIPETNESIKRKPMPLVMPRAKRPAREEASWPRRLKPGVKFNEDKKPYKLKKGEPRGYDPRKLTIADTMEVYNRSFSQPLICLETRKEHFIKLLDFLTAAKAKNLSTIVQFTTIEECEQFAELLRLNNFEHLQVFDNKPPEAHETKLRPDEETVKEQASFAGMITLTTAAGGRAVDYKEIDLCLLTNPTLGRVTDQQKSRVGRNGQLGLVHEIYCRKDFDQLAQNEWKKWDDTNIENKSDSEILREMQERMQVTDLELIDARKQTRELKQEMQKEIQEVIRTNPSVRPQWTNFFTAINQVQDVGEMKQKWETFKNKISKK